MKSLWIFGVAAMILLSLARAENEAENQVNNLSPRSCPNSCSGHGICVNGDRCQCDLGYSGSDCSIQTIPLTSGRAMQNQTVDRYRWNYYFISVPYFESSLVVTVNETSRGDGDVYLQIGDLPTRNSYFKRDISDKSYIEITVSNAQVGTWYIGVYGYSTVNFTVKASVLGACPNGCSQHGSCLNGVCQCNGGYVGSDCAYFVTPIQLNTPVSSTVATNLWKYYSYNFNSGNYMSISLTQYGQGDCDLYLRYDGVPSLWQWTSSNISLLERTSISVIDPAPGMWYVGVHGFAACNFSLVLSTQQSCPNNCSERGTCQTSVRCSCNSGYNGDYCQYRVAALTNGAVDTGFVETGAWNFFSYTSNSQNDLIVMLRQTSSSGDCDIYARAGRDPTSFQFDYSEISTKTSFNLTISQPGRQTWIIGVFGWSTCRFSISVVELSSAQCPNACSGKGTCRGGVCQCNAGFAGEDCGSRVTTLIGNNLKRSEAIRMFGWNYYYFSVNDTSSLHVQVREQNTAGYLWVYINKNVPTLRDYLASDVDDVKSIHRVEWNLAENEVTTYTIGVYGNPYVPADFTVLYDIIAWAAPF